MDNLNYTFNGIGDFTLIRNRTMSQVPFEFQGRCDEVSASAGATVFKAVGGYEGNSGTIEININNITGNLDIFHNKMNRTTVNSTFALGDVMVAKPNASEIRAEFPSGKLFKIISIPWIQTFILTIFILPCRRNFVISHKKIRKYLRFDNTIIAQLL